MFAKLLLDLHFNLWNIEINIIGGMWQRRQGYNGDKECDIEYKYITVIISGQLK